MFVLHDQLTPELDSKVIHFSALTRNDDFLHYSMNGLILLLEQTPTIRGFNRENDSEALQRIQRKKIRRKQR